MRADRETWLAALAAGEAALAHQDGELAPSREAIWARVKELERRIFALENGLDKTGLERLLRRDIATVFPGGY
jgi:hypothetical protein